MGQVAGRVIPRMRTGALLMTLDPAAPLDGQIPVRDDIGCVVAHPCHPSVFNWESTEEAFRDFYGGISARQAVVCALMRGSEDHYNLGVEIATAMYAPVSRVHQVSLEQMAMLEPALVETLAQTCMEAVKEGYDRLVDGGCARPRRAGLRPGSPADSDRRALRRGQRHVLGCRVQNQPARKGGDFQGRLAADFRTIGHS